MAVGLFGAALIYGDGAITPAISVLSALEGLNMATPALQPYVLPAAVAILVALFAIQSQGTAAHRPRLRPGHADLVRWPWRCWESRASLQHPAVFAALNPLYGLSYLFSRRYDRLSGAGRVFLCVTGAEALYADMGHFGSAADPAGLVCDRVSEPDPELCRAGGARARRRADRRQHLLPALPADRC